MCSPDVLLGIFALIIPPLPGKLATPSSLFWGPVDLENPQADRITSSLGEARGLQC